MADTIEQKCLSKGVKLTDQRKVIAKVMSQSNDRGVLHSIPHI